MQHHRAIKIMTMLIVTSLNEPMHVNAAGSAATTLLLNHAGRVYYVQNAIKPWSLQAGRSGTLRFELRSGEQWVGDASRTSERTEIAGRDHFIERSTLSADLRIEPGPANSAAWATLVQFKLSEGSPAFAIELVGERLRVVARTHPNNLASVRRLAEIPLRRSIWCPLRVSLDPKAGEIEVDLCGRALITDRGGVGWPDLTGGYWKVGIYRAPAPETLVVEVRGLMVSGQKP